MSFLLWLPLLLILYLLCQSGDTASRAFFLLLLIAGNEPNSFKRQWQHLSISTTNSVW